MRRLALSALLLLSGAAPAAASAKASYLHYLKALLLSGQGSLPEALREYEAALALDPQSAFVYQQAAELALEMGLTDRAKELAQRFARLEPKNPQAHLLVGNVLWASGDGAGSQAAFETALKLKPGWTEALFALAGLLGAQSPEKSKARFEQYLQAGGENPAEAHYQVALIDQKAGRAAEAERRLRAAVEAEPDHMQARFALAQSYEMRRDTEAAIGAYLELLARDPSNAGLATRLGELYYLTDRRESARAMFTRAKTASPGDPAACLWLSLMAEEDRDFDAAAATLKESSAIGKDPSVDLRLSYYLTQAERLPEAVTALERAHARWPENQEIAYFLALGYDDLKRPRQAIDTMRKVVAARPEHRDARFQLGAFLEKAGEMTAAEAQFREILRVFPDDAPSLNYLGYSFADRGIKLEEAEALAARASAIDPDNGAYLDSLAWARFKLGRREQARADLEKAARMMPEDGTIWDHLGDVYEVFGDTTAAWEAWTLASALSAEPGASAAKAEALEKRMGPERTGELSAALLKRRRGELSSFGGPCAIEGKVGARELRLAGMLQYRAPRDLTVEVLGPLFTPVFRAALGADGGFEMSAFDVPGVPVAELREALAGSLELLRDYLGGSVFDGRPAFSRRGWTKRWVETPTHKVFLDRATHRVSAIQAKGGARLTLGGFRQTGGRTLPTEFRLEGRGFEIGFKLQEPLVR